MQSEAGVAGAMHGTLSAGALTTTFTASQGLLLMIPNMYKMAGELLPAVFHVSARTVATHALSIFGDQSDVMAVRQTGFNMLCSSNPQEAMDMALVAHLASVKASLPFVHFFDGFRTSHQMNNVEVISNKTIKELYPFEKMQAFKNRALNPENPVQKGTAQNPDIFFQNREASNAYYNNVSSIVSETFDELYQKTGRKYNLFDYYGHKEAEKVIVIMGSGADTVEETIDTLNNMGQKCGVVKVRLYRPFHTLAFVNSLPKSVKYVAVLDRTKESGSVGEPLYLDVVSSLMEHNKPLKVVGGRYGLGGKEFTPQMVKAVFDYLNDSAKHNFTVGITDDVTNTSLPVDNAFFTNNSTISCKFYGMGGDGTVSANKSAITIIGENTNLNAQAFFEYDSKKSGNLTMSHLRFGKEPIKSSYHINYADFIACSKLSYLNKYDILADLKQKGIVLLNASHKNQTQLIDALPPLFKQQIAKKQAKLYYVDAESLAKELGLGKKVNTIMESVFFYLVNIIPYEEAKQKIKEQNEKAYRKFGELIIDLNNKAVDLASNYVHEVSYNNSWLKQTNTSNKTSTNARKADYYNQFIAPILALQGNSLPVSSFQADGSVPTDTAKFEKRFIANECPLWLEGKCIECNLCAFVCPHGAIKPVLISEEDVKNLPDGFITKQAKGVSGARYRMQINPYDCTGCGSCVNVCPTKALEMAPIEEVKQKELDNYHTSLTLKNVQNPFPKQSVKGSQFETSYFDVSGACAGCGETPYMKLLTQLFGNRMIIANATGCSSIYGGSAPTCPYKKDEDGKGPSWANSLFEDNAEFGLGIKLGIEKRTQQLLNKVQLLLNKNLKNEHLAATLKMYLLNYFDVTTCQNLEHKLLQEVNRSLVEETDDETITLLKFVKANKNLIVPKSFWIVGGDGWAYDIGFSGIDHILASGKNVNILVLDTEVYSNTGGQSSKASPTASVSKFSAGGKTTRKKDLGLYAMNYKNVYVASVAMGGNPNQLVKALTEAEQYDGPSLIIAYSTCINHGINMSTPQEHMKQAVNSGYWGLYRYNPMLKQQNKNPFVLDSKQANTDKLFDFLKTENRYNQLFSKDEARANELFEQAKLEAEDRIRTYKKLAEIE
jgi:pyruvate-ferredoxin/flavodoxin oxidoreductase